MSMTVLIPPIPTKGSPNGKFTLWKMAYTLFYIICLISWIGMRNIIEQKQTVDFCRQQAKTLLFRREMNIYLNISGFPECYYFFIVRHSVCNETAGFSEIRMKKKIIWIVFISIARLFYFCMQNDYLDIKLNITVSTVSKRLPVNVTVSQMH